MIDAIENSRVNLGKATCGKTKGKGRLELKDKPRSACVTMALAHGVTKLHSQQKQQRHHHLPELRFSNIKILMLFFEERILRHNILSSAYKTYIIKGPKIHSSNGTDCTVYPSEWPFVVQFVGCRKTCFGKLASYSLFLVYISRIRSSDSANISL